MDGWFGLRAELRSSLEKEVSKIAQLQNSVLALTALPDKAEKGTIAAIFNGSQEVDIGPNIFSINSVSTSSIFHPLA